MKSFRTEKDSLGKRKIPPDAFYGAYTSRVLENFRVSGQKVPVNFVRNYVLVKQVYSEVNYRNTKLSRKHYSLIQKSSKKILSLTNQKISELFPIDQIQSGGGTSTNMMVNEIIAGFVGGNVNANDHVNMSQSSNDTFPGVTKITVRQMLPDLINELRALKKVIDAKSRRYKKIQKVGRTHLQDALRISSGDELSAYVATLDTNIESLIKTVVLTERLPLGATALGSFQNVTPAIRKQIIKSISKRFGIKFKPPKNYYESVSSSGDLHKVSVALGCLATDFIKIANDLRLLSSGPRAGISEIILPEVQAGSSIMPGKINPSIPEALDMVCFKVKGLETTIDLATSNAQLNLQVFMPIVGFSLIEMVMLLTNATRMFRERCFEGLKINIEKASENLERSFVYATEYSEVLGYDKVATAVKKSQKNNENLRKLLERLKRK